MRRTPGDPLLAERIVVPHPLLGQWLRLQLAAELGIAAHLRVELPAEFAWEAMREAMPDLAAAPVYEPAYLRWRIFERLGRWDSDDEIARYLADGDARKRFELADRLAIAFDRCLVYRPDRIRAWQAGDPAGWHARLWAELADDGQPEQRGQSRHWVDALDGYRRAMADRAQPERPMRPRVSLFAVATMSPSFLELLHHASAALEIHLFLLSPRSDFWTNLPERTAGGYYAEENELLEAWGRPARDLQGLLNDGHALTQVDRSAPQVSPHGGTCLSTVQAEIVGTAAASGSAVPADPDDTIQIHVCHSPAREVEVLHDRLLGVFDAHPDIQPADVLVLTPDLDTYAPIIAAVFGAAGRIRFQIGRRRFNEGAALSAFLDLLELPGSRYTANAVLAPLRAASVRACFGIGENDLEGIRDAVRRAGIRWGLDAEHRTELDVPASPNHNWRHGLRRLLLGYAIDPGDDANSDVLIDDITPCALDRWGYRSGAADYERLGRFVHYCESTFALNDWSLSVLRPNEWAERLHSEVLDRFLAVPQGSPPEVSREPGTVAQLIDDFVLECGHAGIDTPVPFDVLRDVLREHAAATTRGVPRLADGVTVAGLTVGQALPAEVVCAVGMNDGAFPRRARAMPFDFLSDLFGDKVRQPGDRDLRDDDRYAFLEVLLAARRCLLLTYTGRDLQEDKPIPPSLVVSELTAFLERRFPGADGRREPGRWQTHHPLQPFSPRYFRTDEPALFSYSAPMAAAATALGASLDAPERFAGELDGAGAVATPEIELDDLIRFAASPSRHFARHRLGLHLDVRDDELDDDEPFQLDALQSWQLKSDLADWDKPSELRAAGLATAGGLLPPGNMAEIQHRESAGEVARMQETLLAFSGHTATAEVDVPLHDTRIVGTVERFHGDKNELLWWRIGRIRAKDRIAVWLGLLALTVTRDCRLTAYLFGSKDGGGSGMISGPPPEQALTLLGDWVGAWHEGHSKPLPFFAETSWKWLERPSSAASAWSGQPWSEGNDPVHRMIFGDDPVDESFKELANRLLGPLRAATS